MSGAPDGGWGWVVVVAVTISNLALLPLQQSFGLVFKSRFSELGMTATEMSFIFSLTAAIMGSLGLINGPLMKKFSFRTVAYLGTTVIFFGICLAAFADSLGTIVAAYSIFIAFGQSMMYSAISLAMNTYFCKKRSVAMGLTITLSGLGPIVMPQLIVMLLNNYGTTGTILILAAIALHSFIGASLLRPLDTNGKISDVEQVPMVSGDPEARSRDIETSNKAETDDDSSKSSDPAALEEVKLIVNLRGDETKDKKCDTIVVEDNLLPFSALEESKMKSESILSKISASLDLDLLRNNHFVVIILGMGITLVSEYNFNSMIPLILSELANFTPSEVATVMSVQASADISGRLCVPLITQKYGWPSMNLYAVSLLGSILGRSVLASWSSSYTVIIAASLLLGIAKGTKAVFQALVVPDNVPLAKLPAASGLLMICNGVLSITLGPLIGLVHDKTHSYVTSLHFTSALSLSCILLWIGERVYNSSRKTSKEPSQDGKNCEEN